MPFPNRLHLTICMLCGLLAAFAGVILYGSHKPLPAGMTIAGWPVAGLTAPDLEQQLELRIQALEQMKVELAPDPAHGKPLTFTLQQLGLQADTQAVRTALTRLHTGSVLSKAAARWSLRNRSLPVSASFDPGKAKEALRSSWPYLYDAKPVNAKRIVQADDSIQYMEEQNVQHLDEQRFMEQLNNLLPAAVLLNPSPPQPVAPLTLPLVTVAAGITVEKLKAQGIERKLIEFTTLYPLLSNSAGRIYNIRSTAESIQDYVMEPGHIFDYSNFIRKTEETFGYKDAPVIMNGKLVPGIGGGICQVSTTLYNAVLRSGLKIVERRNHSLPISYAPLGQDATFASGYINFRFQNTTGAHLLIRTSASEKGITVKLFGSAPANISYEVDSQTIETIQPPVKYVHNPQLPVGKSVKLSEGKPGYIVETYRIKKVDGAIVDRSLVSKDTYMAQPTLMSVNSGASSVDPGTVKPPAAPSPIVEDGVKGPIFR